ncbi:MAG: hypothetical protein BMS9Abin25_0771 [Gammaproteobacteria bacterium]|nr:MAG: hypothetical protein BMS9Abin25_0771 [Gammaproteobacteria bacterium]
MGMYSDKLLTRSKSKNLSPQRTQRAQRKENNRFVSINIYQGYSPKSRRIQITYADNFLKTSVSSVSSVVKSLLTFTVENKGDKDVYQELA